MRRLVSWCAMYCPEGWRRSCWYCCWQSRPAGNGASGPCLARHMLRPERPATTASMPMRWVPTSPAMQRVGLQVQIRLLSLLCRETCRDACAAAFFVMCSNDKYSLMQEERGDTDEFRDVSKKVERREALTSLRKAADIIDATVQV